MSKLDETRAAIQAWRRRITLTLILSGLRLRL